jgi:hypothetical protein
MLWIPILLCLHFSTLHGASSEAPPERELLQMMEFFQEWEMIQNLELMQQMESVGRIENTWAREAVQTPAPEIPIEDGQKWNGNLR